MFKTIAKEIEAEIVEKKSKFIANLYYVQTEAEAQAKVEEIRKKHYDARHHCYAYRIETKEEKVERMSDDGEPSGTAGAPLLNILRKQELANVIVIVTRYFGGILLGTGGLVRAYSDACQKALEEAVIVEEQSGMELKIEIPYNNLEKIKYFCQKNGISIFRVEYGDKVAVICEVTQEERENLEQLVMNLQIEKIVVEKYKNIRK